MEDTIKIELLTPLTGTFLPNEMEQDWEEEDYNDFEEEQVFFEGDDLTEYASVIQEKIAEYNCVGHDDDRTCLLYTSSVSGCSGLAYNPGEWHRLSGIAEQPGRTGVLSAEGLPGKLRHQWKFVPPGRLLSLIHI